MKMKAKRRMLYAGRMREIGEVFEANAKDAKILSLIGAESFTGEYQTRVMTADQPGTRALRRQSMVSKSH